MSPDKNLEERDLPAAGEMSEREIDKSLMESFPASDPPSWTLGTDHQRDPTKSLEQNDKRIKETHKGKDIRRKDSD